MLNIELDEPSGIAILEPDGKLSRSDFEAAAKITGSRFVKADTESIHTRIEANVMDWISSN